MSEIEQIETIALGLSCHLDQHFLNAAIPLFAEEKVRAIEWSFDTLYNYEIIPDWFIDLIQEYGKSNRLVGHGVYFSLLSGKWSNDQEAWLMALKKTCKTFQFDHVSEHFGFMTGIDFHHGAPLPVPFTKEVLAIGQDRLKRISEVSECPVGIENLAFSFTSDQVKRQGEFLSQLVEPVNGFLILDLHNVYCQLHNFDLDFETLISFYPLEKVREIHVSGGSWQVASSDSKRKIRRDTHDSGVPEEVFELLQQVIEHCPNVKYVMLEQLGRGLVSPESKLQFQNDFLRLSRCLADRSIGSSKSNRNPFLPEILSLPKQPIENDLLFHQQVQLSSILEDSRDIEDARIRLNRSTLAGTEWGVEEWHDDMLGTAIKIAQKWKTGFRKLKPV